MKRNIESYIANQFDTIQLEDLDPAFSGFWIKLRKPLLMPRAEYERVWSGDRRDEDPRDVITNRLSAHVVDWNLIGYDGKSLSLPSSSNGEVNSLDLIPWNIVEMLATKIMLLHTESVDALRLVLGLGNEDSQEGEGKADVDQAQAEKEEEEGEKLKVEEEMEKAGIVTLPL